MITVNCTRKITTIGQIPNGWYLLDSSKSDSIGELIVSVKDFDSLRVESWQMSHVNNIDSVYVIKGKVKALKIKDYADGTEKAIGKGLIFLYNGDIICTPIPNCRIDEGNFAISSQELSTDKKIIQDMYNSLITEMQE